MNFHLGGNNKNLVARLPFKKHIFHQVASQGYIADTGEFMRLP